MTDISLSKASCCGFSQIPDHTWSSSESVDLRRSWICAGFRASSAVAVQIDAGLADSPTGGAGEGAVRWGWWLGILPTSAFLLVFRPGQASVELTCLHLPLSAAKTPPMCKWHWCPATWGPSCKHHESATLGILEWLLVLAWAGLRKM